MDLIDRQAAIDALAEQMPLSFTPDGSHPADEGIFRAQEIYADCIETIKLLPAVQPQPVVRCKDCKWSDISVMGHLAVCNHARGLVNPSPNSYCNFAERRTDEQTD